MTLIRNVPPAQVQQPAQVGDERVRHELAVLVDPGPPGMFRDPGDRVHLGVGARPAHGELPPPALRAAAGGDVFEQVVGEPRSVQADQEPVAELSGQSGHGLIEQGDVSGVRGRP